jgi:hypothetical protein
MSIKNWSEINYKQPFVKFYFVEGLVTHGILFHFYFEWKYRNLMRAKKKWNENLIPLIQISNDYLLNTGTINDIIWIMNLFSPADGHWSRNSTSKIRNQLKGSKIPRIPLSVRILQKSSVNLWSLGYSRLNWMKDLI